jgi:hypothetical protein
VLRRGWRGADRERSGFPGAARPWVRDDGRSAPPGLSSPPPAGPTAAGGQPWDRGKKGKAPRKRPAGQEGGPARPDLADRLWVRAGEGLRARIRRGENLIPHGYNATDKRL